MPILNKKRALLATPFMGSRPKTGGRFGANFPNSARWCRDDCERHIPRRQPPATLQKQALQCCVYRGRHSSRTWQPKTRVAWKASLRSDSLDGGARSTHERRLQHPSEAARYPESPEAIFDAIGTGTRLCEGLCEVRSPDSCLCFECQPSFSSVFSGQRCRSLRGLAYSVFFARRAW